MATTRGKFCIFGTKGIEGTAGIVTANKIFVHEANLTLESDTVSLKNNEGVDVTDYYYNYRKRLRLRMTPYDGTSVTNAAENWQAPAIGTFVTITADTTKEKATALEFAGNNWQVVNINKRLTTDGIAEYDIELVAKEGITA
jgi:hypothetical protein